MKPVDTRDRGLRLSQNSIADLKKPIKGKGRYTLIQDMLNKGLDPASIQELTGSDMAALLC